MTDNDTASNFKTKGKEEAEDSAEKIVKDIIAQTPEIPGGYDDPQIEARISRLVRKRIAEKSQKKTSD